MRVVHLLRKYDTAEWGGTETAVHRLFEGFQHHAVTPLLYCPYPYGGNVNQASASNGHSATNGHVVKRYNACVPVWGISSEERRKLTAVGGNLMSFDLMPTLLREKNVSLIHTHTLGRLGAIGANAARLRRLPLIVTIHGGVMDLPEPLKNEFNKRQNGFDWGRIFGLLLRSRQLLSKADAVLTCNPVEASLLRKKLPNKRVEVQPHSIPTGVYQKDHRAAAREAFPQINQRRVLLCAGRIDPVKNQHWLVEQMRTLINKHPDAFLVLAGACTDVAYGRSIDKLIRESDLADRVLVTGGLPADDARLIGLFQEAQALVLPSVSETFGLVILEAWAAGTPVISSRTSGASALVQHGENGWLFDLQNPGGFHDAVDRTLSNESLRCRLAAAGHDLAKNEFDVTAVAGRLKHLYHELVEEKHALRNPA